MVEKYIPKILARTIYEIDYSKLYDNGKRIILFDLDNTLASYDDIIPTSKQMELNQTLRQIGFKIYILSNNHQKRAELYTQKFIVDGYLHLARKPFVGRIQKFLSRENINYFESIWIGDQLLTDISCANKLGIDSVLVSSISRNSEKWYTRINRKREEHILRKIAKTNSKMAIEIQKIIDNEEI